MNLPVIDSQWSDDLDDDEYPDEYDDDEQLESDVVECPQCGAEIYEDAEQCPNCGAYVSFSSSPWSDRPWWWIVLGVLGMLSFLLWALV